MSTAETGSTIMLFMIREYPNTPIPLPKFVVDLEMTEERETLYTSIAGATARITSNPVWAMYVFCLIMSILSAFEIADKRADNLVIPLFRWIGKYSTEFLNAIMPGTGSVMIIDEFRQHLNVTKYLELTGISMDLVAEHTVEPGFLNALATYMKCYLADNELMAIGEEANRRVYAGALLAWLLLSTPTEKACGILQTCIQDLQTQIEIHTPPEECSCPTYASQG